MNEKEYKVTHVFVMPAEEKGWIKMAYVVEKDRKYFIGENSPAGWDEKNLEKLIKDKALIKLKNPITKNLNQGLWLTPDYEIYLSDKKNPLGKDEERTFVCKLNI